MRFSRQRINPVEYLRDQHCMEVPWITFDPTVRGYNAQTGRKISRAGHDGTLLLTFQNIDAILTDLVARTVYRLIDGPEKHPDCLPFYRLGWIHLVTTYPVAIDLPIGRYPGQREQASVRYRVDWGPKGEAERRRE